MREREVGRGALLVMKGKKRMRWWGRGEEKRQGRIREGEALLCRRGGGTRWERGGNRGAEKKDQEVLRNSEKKRREKQRKVRKAEERQSRIGW